MLMKDIDIPEITLAQATDQEKKTVEGWYKIIKTNLPTDTDRNFFVGLYVAVSIIDLLMRRGELRTFPDDLIMFAAAALHVRQMEADPFGDLPDFDIIERDPLLGGSKWDTTRDDTK